MRLDDSFCECEAEPDASASGREKGLENLVCQCFGYAGSAINEHDGAGIAFGADLDAELSFGRSSPARRYWPDSRGHSSRAPRLRALPPLRQRSRIPRPRARRCLSRGPPCLATGGAMSACDAGFHGWGTSDHGLRVIEEPGIFR